ncbi:hypothetical protein ACYSNW_11750 [Enterococcus sp. LJL99]
MTEISRKSRKIRKQGNASTNSFSKEVSQTLPLNEADKLDSLIRKEQVLSEKTLKIKVEHVTKTFYEEIDYVMNQHDRIFKNLVER